MECWDPIHYFFTAVLQYSTSLGKFLEGQLIVGVDTNPGSRAHRLFRNRSGLEVRVLHQGSGGSQRVIAPGTDSDQIIVRFYDVAAAGNYQQVINIGDNQKRLQAAQHSIRAPVFGELDRGALQISIELFQFRFEFFEQREGVRRSPRKAGDHSVMMKLAHLPRIVLHHRLAEADLPVPRDDNFAAAPNRQYRCTVHHRF